MRWRFILLLVLCNFTTASLAQEESQALFVVHFSTGPNWDTALAPNQQTAFGEHSANLNRLRQENRIVFGARYSEFGMIFVSANSLQEVDELIGRDPGVVAEIFIFTAAKLNVFYPWQAN